MSTKINSSGTAWNTFLTNPNLSIWVPLPSTSPNQVCSQHACTDVQCATVHPLPYLSILIKAPCMACLVPQLQYWVQFCVHLCFSKKLYENPILLRSLNNDSKDCSPSPNTKDNCPHFVRNSDNLLEGCPMAPPSPTKESNNNYKIHSFGGNWHKHSQACRCSYVAQYIMLCHIMLC